MKKPEDVLLILIVIIPALCGIPLCPSPSALSDTYLMISGILTICNIQCNMEGDYTVDHRSSMVFSYNCLDRSLHVYGGYKNRTRMDKRCGCVSISDVRYSDTGRYFIYFNVKDQKISHNTIDCHVMAPISIGNISVTSSGEKSSLTVIFTGDGPATVIWSKIGGELPEGHLLTDHNKTLTIAGAVTGTYRVVVGNHVSKDSQEYTAPMEVRSYFGIIGCGAIFFALLLTGLVLITRREICKERKGQYSNVQCHGLHIGGTLRLPLPSLLVIGVEDEARHPLNITSHAHRKAHLSRNSGEKPR
ncbi:uncharacterized protein RB166_014918 [Leptodactylus fuscus]|uniref:uncharacterized protein LOC142214600 n=1 Tax=Leptodactylus fuscus TaxID=238119 RepID=UPI003F4F0F38